MILVSAKIRESSRLTSVSFVVDNREDTRVTLYDAPFEVAFYPSDIPDGVHTVRARATWRSGRTADADAKFTTDNLAPVVTSVSPEPGGAISPPWEISLRFQVDEPSGIAQGWVETDDGTRVCLDADTLEASLTFPVSSSFPQETLLTWSLEDRAGNVATGVSRYSLTHAVLSARLAVESSPVSVQALDSKSLLMTFVDEAWNVGVDGQVAWVVAAEPDSPFIRAFPCSHDNLYLATEDAASPGQFLLRYITGIAKSDALDTRSAVSVEDGPYGAAACGPSTLFGCATGSGVGDAQSLVVFDGQQVVPFAQVGGDGYTCTALRVGTTDDLELVAVLTEAAEGGAAPTIDLFQENGTQLWSATVAEVAMVHDFVAMGASRIAVLGSSADQGHPVVVGVGGGDPWRFDPPQNEVVSGILPISGQGVVLRSRLESGPGRLRAFDLTGNVVYDLFFDSPMVAWDVQNDTVAVALEDTVHLVGPDGSIQGVWEVPMSASGDDGEGGGITGILGFGDGSFSVLEGNADMLRLWRLDAQGKPLWSETLAHTNVLAFARSVAGDAVLLEYGLGVDDTGAAVRAFATFVP